jgi:hypothetical protein
MKLAWFRPDQPSPPPSLDDSAALVAELRSTHEIEQFTAANAHDFTRRHARAAYDLSVYELDDTIAHAFIWPYLLHYGGVLQLRTLSLHQSRATVLFGEQRAQDYAAEFTFSHGDWPGQPPVAPLARPGDWSMLRVPALAARIVVLSHEATIDVVQRAHPEALVRLARTGVCATPETQGDHRGPPAAPVHPGPAVMFGAVPGDRLDVVRRAMARARHAGAPADLMAEASPELLVQNADVVVSLTWPSRGEPQTPALAAMAAAKPVIVSESPASAGWPALDPQTWQPRGRTPDAPIAISIDPRDEEHSLVLAIRRLSAEATLRAQLGQAARNWWRTHATPELAADDWRRILDEAALLPAPLRPVDWPAHLTADGTMRDLERLNAGRRAGDVLSP